MTGGNKWGPGRRKLTTMGGTQGQNSVEVTLGSGLCSVLLLFPGAGEGGGTACAQRLCPGGGTLASGGGCSPRR